MNSRLHGAMSAALLAALVAGAAYTQAPLAATPPMGWNSWDCFGTTVTEAEVKANADYMAKHLKSHGWQYIVVDIQWSEQNPKTHGYRPERRPGDGRVRPPDPGPEPLSIVRGRQGLQAAGRLRAPARAEVRHPHHARHPAARGGGRSAGLQQRRKASARRQQGIRLPLEHRHVRRRRQPSREAGTTTIRSWDSTRPGASTSSRRTTCSGVARRATTARRSTP